ncbi:translation elongation factor EF-1 subunit alpha [Pelomyxa schiedti]|nr:translation elongation factor EF-1 subunit alpha [Pelomyxa schiedti]
MKSVRDIKVVVVGSASVGKSTVVGRLMVEVGGHLPPTRRLFMSGVMRESDYRNDNNAHRPSTYAELSDIRRYEWERGFSATHHTFFLKNVFPMPCPANSKEGMGKGMVLVDTPGQKKFFKSAVRGIFGSDVAVLVTVAPYLNPDGFRDLLTACYASGIQNIVVAVNYMDEVNWSEERYRLNVECVSEIAAKIGYKVDRQVQFVPMSAEKGVNISGRAISDSNVRPLEWYRGPTLYEAICRAEPRSWADSSKPLRMAVHEPLRICGVGIVLVGSIVSGTVKPGDQVALSRPSKIISTVGSIEYNYDPLERAFPGSIVGVNTRSVCRWDFQTGDVIGLRDNHPPMKATMFCAHIVVTYHPKTIKRGYTPTMFCHQAQLPCRIQQILCTFNKDTKNTVRARNPPTISTGDCASVLFRPLKPICVEEYKAYPSLGRIILRDLDRVVAVGVVTLVYYSLPCWQDIKPILAGWYKNPRSSLYHTRVPLVVINSIIELVWECTLPAPITILTPPKNLPSNF